MNTHTMTAQKRALRRTYKRRAVICLIAATVILAGAHTVQAKWKVAVDRSEHACLDPYRWFLVSMGAVEPQVGEIVTFKSSGIPLYADGTLFTKQVLAGPGATVRVTAFGVEVDGAELPFTEEGLQQLASTGGLLPIDEVREYTVGEGELFVHGTNPRSYDSRYYGPVAADRIIGKARPLW